MASDCSAVRTNTLNMNNIEIIDFNYSNDKQVNTFKEIIPKLTYLIEPTGAKFEEAKRVIAIVYSYNKNTIMYGASIFKKTNKKDVCIKSQISSTAYERFYSDPVIFNIQDTFVDKNNSEDIDNTNKSSLKWNDVVKSIRFKMYTCGVKGNKKDHIFKDENKKNETAIIKNRLPKISYILEPSGSDWSTANRIIAIVYSYKGDEITYGASIFKRAYPHETCIKANIRQTALDRFEKHPITFRTSTNTTCSDSQPTDSDDKSESKSDNSMGKLRVGEVLRNIRKIMHKYGVKNSSVPNMLTISI